MRESTLGSATGGEEPEQQPPMSPPRRRQTEVMIREPVDMDSENVFKIYSAPEALAAPPSRKKTSKRHPGESIKAPQAKKPPNAGLPEDGPSANATPPSPHEQQTPPAPDGSTPSPVAPTDQTQQAGPASTGAMLTLIAGRLRSSAVTEQAKYLEQRHADELKAAAAKYAKQLAVVFEENNKLAEELREKQKSLDKATEQKDRANFNYLPKNARNAELAHCASRLAEEERLRIPASPEISLATGMDGADNEAADVVDQSPPQDPSAP
ncbi:uncharacterized protein LOC133791696 [Humulus lupulus]|uniref:uncharacterized protein LOC133791696 n=1 Tax=Humulus lupulus TaxID=3486 RepID=UPI002B4166EE|nr:uncharacterized protein LOC133791696 [Humulus lupulus]